MQTVGDVVRLKYLTNSYKYPVVRGILSGMTDGSTLQPKPLTSVCSLCCPTHVGNRKLEDTSNQASSLYQIPNICGAVVVWLFVVRADLTY